MSLATVLTRAQLGMDAPLVTVEVHLSNGLPAFNIVGLPDAAVRESKERVRSAILNSKYEFPQRRITVNLAPADLPKDGGRFDLPIAIGILVASDQLKTVSPIEQMEFVGELALSGELRPITGTLTASVAATGQQHPLFVPMQNQQEAAFPSEATVFGADSLLQVCSHLTGLKKIAPTTTGTKIDTPTMYPDMADVKGQHQARRALEVAAAGNHNLLMIGPPGAGKSMLAARLPGILPPPTEQDQLEIAAIHSIANCHNASNWRQRPIRTPHHTASTVSLAGGGSHPKPGEISLAHNGVLFLDELPEFPRKALEVLREPLENGEIAISRASHQVTYPANFQLITAMNPCPCGQPDRPPESCGNPVKCCNRYQSKLSGPLLDRIDIHLRVEALSVPELQNQQHGEGSEPIRTRVITARTRQLDRQGKPNHGLSARELEQHCDLAHLDDTLVAKAIERLNLSARGFHRVLKVARTIADLVESNNIEMQHLMEAFSYRAAIQ